MSPQLPGRPPDVPGIRKVACGAPVGEADNTSMAPPVKRGAAGDRARERERERLRGAVPLDLAAALGGEQARRRGRGRYEKTRGSDVSFTSFSVGYG